MAVTTYNMRDLDDSGRCGPEIRTGSDAAFAYFDNDGHLCAARSRVAAAGRDEDDGHGCRAQGRSKASAERNGQLNWNVLERDCDF